MTDPRERQLATPVSSYDTSWRGWLAFGLLVAVGALGPDISPSRYYPDLDHYLSRYILLALSVGCAIHAIRAGRRGDQLIGLGVLVAGLGLVAHVVRDSLRTLGR
jgi:hypothetical protein